MNITKIMCSFTKIICSFTKIIFSITKIICNFNQPTPIDSTSADADENIFCFLALSVLRRSWKKNLKVFLSA